MQLVLASGSPRRRELLENLGIEFRLELPADDAEKPLPRHLPLARLQQLLPQVSEGKGLDVARRCPAGQLIIAADTVVYAHGQVMGKPTGRNGAREHLQRLSGKKHRVLSSVSLVWSDDLRVVSAVEVTEVRFRMLSSAEIDTYIATGEPLDKAGSYGIQGWGGLLVESIRGRFDNVVGFPMVTLEQLLETHNLSLYQFRRSC